MANYRGGDRAMSSWGQQAVRAINEGRTERQRQRDFNQKLIFAAVQAGLTGARAIGQGVHDDSEAAKKAAKEDMLTPERKAQLAKYTDGIYKKALGRERTFGSAMPDAGTGASAAGYGAVDTRFRDADEALQRAKVSDAASMATDHDRIGQESDRDARDIRTGLDGMAAAGQAFSPPTGGGMMGSQPKPMLAPEYNDQMSDMNPTRRRY